MLNDYISLLTDIKSALDKLHTMNKQLNKVDNLNPNNNLICINTALFPCPDNSQHENKMTYNGLKINLCLLSSYNLSLIYNPIQISPNQWRLEIDVKNYNKLITFFLIKISIVIARTSIPISNKKEKDKIRAFGRLFESKCKSFNLYPECGNKTSITQAIEKLLNV